jgi:hypothetical protein
MPLAALGIFLIVAEWAAPLGAIFLLLSGVPLALVLHRHIKQKVQYQLSHQTAMPNDEPKPWKEEE